ncbi:hypothetical protein PPERSA_03841 [Pseudocohnilembus persalinus]|uniref:Uncharacterized protein n=1 Tax=Pseudocohnilembus persalinus TaxID=266149 RepID=A0A0V0QV98_PSEPJ|nr:hypothetical protein PPERSA_03841 [Pseudocohnilembus persalinus]|eukprot:KRX05904.1 hypothetical protein PPERSA_03841 [Pseudocohnilembus persalinus]
MEDQQQIQNPDLEIIPEESRSHAIPMNKEEIQERLQQLKIQAKKEMNSEIENQFVDLLSAATQFYGDEMAYELAQFYYEYGSALLNRLVNNTDDIFGDLLKKQQKKEEENQDEEEQQDYQNDEEQENQTESKYQQENKQEQHQQINKQEIKEQKVVFKDQDVEIVDENQNQNSENQLQQQKEQKNIEQLKNNGQNEKQQLQQQQDQDQEEETKENQNKEEDADDMQISYENLYTALRIGEKDLENVKRQYSDDQIKQDSELRQKVIFLADCCNRLGEFENWREKFDDALEYLGKAQDYLQKVLNPNSREIATNKFMQANTILYKQESDETIALKYFIEFV